jgi:hypothetical protein
MQPKMLGLTLAAAAAVAGWNAARRIAAIRPAAGAPSTAERTPESGGGGGGQPAGRLRAAEPELAVYAQIADLRERMAGCEPQVRRRVPLPRREHRAAR